MPVIYVMSSHHWLTGRVGRCRPAGHVPVSHVLPSECVYSPHDKYSSDLIAQIAAQEMQEASGLPVGVSVASLPFNDEMVLHVMSLLEKKFPFRPAL